MDCRRDVYWFYQYIYVAISNAAQSCKRKACTGPQVGLKPFSLQNAI